MGWYVPGYGTSIDDLGNLMDLYDIPNHSVANASIADLARELEAGHGVIVGVNSGQLWDTGPLNDLINFICKVLGLDNSTYMPADHAITVTGIDMSDPSNPMVIINDSGVPNGQAMPYPLDKFMDAWENAHCAVALGGMFKDRIILSEGDDNTEVFDYQKNEDLLKAAEQGDADAQNNLGHCYQYGNGVEEDKEEAVRWYKKAAEQGDADAQNNLIELNDNRSLIEKGIDALIRFFSDI